MTRPNRIVVVIAAALFTGAEVRPSNATPGFTRSPTAVKLGNGLPKAASDSGSSFSQATRTPTRWSYKAAPFRVGVLIGTQPQMPGAAVSPLSGASPSFARLKPRLKSPPDGATYEHYPRTIDLEWYSIPSAVAYRVEIQYDNSTNRSRRWASLWTRDATTNHLTISYVGAQWGRWRVWAINGNHEETQRSAWATFLFTH